MSKSFAQIGLDRSIPHIGVIMEKFDVSNYPVFTLPDNYNFSYYRPGFEKQWAALQYELEEADSLEEAETAFVRTFLLGTGMNWINKSNQRTDTLDIQNSPKFKAMTEKMIFVLDRYGTVAGTGSVWDGDIFGKVYQRLHYIAVAPEHQGRGIARAIVTKLLDIYNDLGYGGYIYLTSQTWSYKALNIYSKFGFRPYLGERPAKWKSVNLTSGNFEPWDYKEKNLEAWNMINEKIRLYTTNTEVKNG